MNDDFDMTGGATMPIDDEDKDVEEEGIKPKEDKEDEEEDDEDDKEDASVEEEAEKETKEDTEEPEF